MFVLSLSSLAFADAKKGDGDAPLLPPFPNGGCGAKRERRKTPAKKRLPSPFMRIARNELGNCIFFFFVFFSLRGGKQVQTGDRA